MKTYKLGNKIKCIIRSYSTGMIGEQYMKYPNQPYTVLKDVEANLVFNDYSREAKQIQNQLAYSIDFLKEVNISNIELNDKILNLIFSSNEDKLLTTTEDITITDNYIRINTDVPDIYQAFLYNSKGVMVAATSNYKLGRGSATKIYLNNFEYCDEEYRNRVNEEEPGLIVFSYEGSKSFKLKKDFSLYLVLDLILEGNEENENQIDLANTSCIHIGKCVLQIDKNMYFNRALNTVDLKFVIIEDRDVENYITLE